MKNDTFVDKKIRAYFEKRTPLKSSAREYIFGKKQSGLHSIIVNDNDYLRLSNCSAVIEKQAAHLHVGYKQVMMSRSLVTDQSLHMQVEKEFARFLKKESALITQSGYVANMSLLQGISNSDTVVYADYFIHESFRAGIKSSGAKQILFTHNSVEDLLEKIKKHGPGIILVESINSAFGTVCPLEKIAKIKNTYGCVLVVDESHSLGLYGKQGAGLVEQLGLSESVDFITASLSKAFCTRAGLILGKEEIISFIQEVSSTVIFSSAILEYDLVRLQTMLKVIKNADEKRQNLMNIAMIIRKALLDMGYNIASTSIPSPIISLVAGAEDSLRVLRAFFDDHDIFASVFFSPATPKNYTFHRLSLHSELSALDVKRIIEACKILKEQSDPAIFKHLFSNNQKNDNAPNRKLLSAKL